MGIVRQIPNLLGLFRIVVTPLMAYWIVINDAWAMLWAALLLFIMAMSDVVDGALARKMGVVSPLGIFLDTISDKIFVAGALLPLIQIQLLPSWIGLVIIFREFAVSGLRSYAASQGVVIPAGSWGKQKLTLTVTGLIWLMVYTALQVVAAPAWLTWLSTWWQSPMALGVIWTIASGIEYFWNARALLAKAITPEHD